jgi:hypothetical protein
MVPNYYQPVYPNDGLLYLLHDALAYRHSHQWVEPLTLLLRRNGAVVRGWAVLSPDRYYNTIRQVTSIRAGRLDDDLVRLPRNVTPDSAVYLSRLPGSLSRGRHAHTCIGRVAGTLVTVRRGRVGGT